MLETSLIGWQPQLDTPLQICPCPLAAAAALTPPPLPPPLKVTFCLFMIFQRVAQVSATTTDAAPWRQAAGTASANQDGGVQGATLPWKLSVLMERTTKEVTVFCSRGEKKSLKLNVILTTENHGLW